jgi:hypothetical protein
MNVGPYFRRPSQASEVSCALFGSRLSSSGELGWVSYRLSIIERVPATPFLAVPKAARELQVVQYYTSPTGLSCTTLSLSHRPPKQNDCLHIRPISARSKLHVEKRLYSPQSCGSCNQIPREPVSSSQTDDTPSNGCPILYLRSQAIRRLHARRCLPS